MWPAAPELTPADFVVSGLEIVESRKLGGLRDYLHFIGEPPEKVTLAGEDRLGGSKYAAMA